MSQPPARPSSRPGVDPVRWTPPPQPPERQAGHLQGVVVHETSGYGTEDILIAADGRILTGVDDGRVLALDPRTGEESVLFDTGGRPLGLEHHPDGGHVVCDSTRGLLRVTDDLQIDVLADSHEGRPFLFCNNAAVATDGTIYFTDSSTKFGFDHWRGDLIEHRPTGRLFRRDPDGILTVLLDDLAFGNGVALAPDESFLIVAETAAYALRRVWLTGDRAGTSEPFADTLPGFPDNISTGEDGHTWVAIASPRDAALDLLLPRPPWLRKVVWALPERLQPQAKAVIHVRSYASDGTLVHDIAGTHPRFGKPTGLRQIGDTVWMGSFEQTTIASLTLP